MCMARVYRFSSKFKSVYQCKNIDKHWFTCLLAMEFRFDAMLYCDLANENSEVGNVKRSH